MMKDEELALLREPIFHFFHQLCQIPRPSKKEQAVSGFLLNWAKTQGLDASRDEACNVLIRKAASPGYENAPVVMLQAHMDMVCEKAPGVRHDFERDPICWQLDGDLLSTGGRTTLGADNGIGVAFAMAILAETELSHPALEVLFTTAEEEDFSGASGFDSSLSRATRLINLDHASDTEILCGSCGGMAADFTLPVHAEPVPAGWSACQLTVSGLMGGHSGEDIHRGHGNANVILARILLALEKCIPFALGPVRGGSFRLAIPRDAQAVLCFPAEHKAFVEETVRSAEQTISRELSATGTNLSCCVSPAPLPSWCVKPDSILTAIVLSPDGICQMNETLTGLVDTSDNLGELYLDENAFHMVFEIRSAQPSLGQYLYERMERLARMLGGSCTASKAYPSWEFRPQSELRAIADQVWETQFGSAPSHLTIHAGLEVGVLSEKIPGLDAIAIGPNCWNFHSPAEQLSVSSARRVYKLLRDILTACR